MFAKPRGMHQVCDFYGGKTMCVTDFYNSKMFFYFNLAVCVLSCGYSVVTYEYEANKRNIN